MKQRFFKNMIITCLSLVYITGCTAVKEKIQTAPAFPQEEYENYIRQGDASFAKMHLSAWRKAGELYSKAYELKQTPELRDKRFLTLCLTALREKDEQIVNPRTFETIDALEDFTKTPRQQYLFDIVQHYRSAPVVRNGEPRLRSKEKKEVDITLFDIQNSPLDAYLYLYFLNYYSFDFSVYDEQLTALFEKYRLLEVTAKHTEALSPLFVYSNFPRVRNRADEIEAAFPEFAEFYQLKGTLLFRDNKLKNAAVYLRKALELVPDYPAALNGMGNIYYFTVRNYEEAIRYYDQTLGIDPLNPVALFGKGVSLHFLERYEESDAVFDFMLANQSKHHGEAYYYKAYNRHMQDEPGKARPLVDKAKELLPRSGEVCFLSGLLYFNEDKYKEATNDFYKAVDDPAYSNCYPLYYLGMIKMKSQDWGFLRKFSDSLACLRSREQQMEDRLRDVDGMDLGEQDKAWMKRDLRAKIDAFKETSQKMIQQMELIIEKNKDKKAAIDRQENSDALKRVKEVLESNPGLLNGTDDSGTTFLHKAIEDIREDVVLYLLDKGMRLDIVNAEGYTPLHWAVMLNRTDILRLLIRGGADVNVKAYGDMTPLHDAAYAGYTESARLLLDAGADPYVKEEQGKTPLYLASVRGNKDMYDMLKPLHKAVEKGDLETVKDFLYKRPELVNAVDENERTPLFIAAESGHEEIARFLIRGGANVDARDTGGITPLMRAKERGQTGIIQLLLTNGASVPDEEILNGPMAEKSAAVWYLNDISWAVKVGERFLVFDYTPVGMSRTIRETVDQRLSNGYINPRRIEGQDVVVFVTHELVNLGDPRFIFEWKKTVPRITYILGWNGPAGTRNFNLTPGMEKSLEGMEVSAIDMVGEGAAYLVQTGGITILFAGSHGSWDESRWNDYTGQIDALARKVSSVDIVFLFFPNDYSPGKGLVDKGNLYALEKLKAGMMFPIYTGVGKMPIDGFAREAAARGIGTVIQVPVNRGDRFIYKSLK